MIGRSFPRDYIDVAGAAASTTRAELLRTAFEHDPGLRVNDVAGAMHQLDQLRTKDFARYGLDEDAVAPSTRNVRRLATRPRRRR